MYCEISPFINYSNMYCDKDSFFSGVAINSTVSSRCASSKLVSSLNSAYTCMIRIK